MSIKIKRTFLSFANHFFKMHPHKKGEFKEKRNYNDKEIERLQRQIRACNRELKKQTNEIENMKNENHQLKEQNKKLQDRAWFSKVEFDMAVEIKNESEKKVSDLQNECKKLRRRAFLQKIRHCMLREHYGGDTKLSWSKLFTEFSEDYSPGCRYIDDSMNCLGYSVPIDFNISSSSREPFATG